MPGKSDLLRLLSLIALTLPTAASAQEYMVQGMVSHHMPQMVGPSFVGPTESDGYFHQVSTPEVLARPVAQADPGYAVEEGVPQLPHDPSNPPLSPLAIPTDKLNCCPCEDKLDQCTFVRFLKKPTHLTKKQMECVICVKEPFTTTVPVKEQVDAVVFRCFSTKDQFEYQGCEDGTCFHKSGTKELKRFRPCTIKVDLNYEKQVVKYRDAWYYIDCPCK